VLGFSYSPYPPSVSTTSDPRISFTRWVLNATYSFGQTTFTDTPSPGQATIVINNDNNQAKAFDLGTAITITVNGYSGMLCFVDSVSYSDAHGSLKGATATLNCTGVLGRIGKSRVTSKAITQTSTEQQLEQFNGSIPSLIKFARPASAYAYGIAQGAQTYTGTVLQYLQTTQQTEANLVRAGVGYIFFPSYIDHVYWFSGVPETLTPDASTTNIVYESIDRNYLDSELANSVTVTPAGLSGQVGTNSTSIANYDQRDYSRGTYDYATATALSTANWLASILSDRAVQIFTVSFTAEAQDSAAFAEFLNYGVLNNSPGIKLFYRTAGSSDLKYEWVFVANIECNATPSTTVFTLTCMPANMFCPFVVGLGGSDNYAKLGVSRYNLLPNPSAETDVLGYTGTKFSVAMNYSDGTYPTNIDGIFIGYGSCLGTVSTGTAGQWIQVGDKNEPNKRVVVLASTTYTFSAYIYTPTSNTANTNWRVTANGYTIANAATTSAVGTTTTVTRGVFTRLSVTYTTSSTTVRVALLVESTSTLAVGQTVYIDNCMLETGSTLNEYFDGSLRPAEWVGTKNDSASVLDSNYFRYGRTV